MRRADRIAFLSLLISGLFVSRSASPSRAQANLVDLPSIDSANGVNDAGQVTGSGRVNGSRHALVYSYSDGKIVDLGTICRLLMVE